MTEKRKPVFLFLGLLLMAVFLAFLPADTLHAEETGIVVYDAADFSNLSGRTQSEVMEKYTEATAAGIMYLNNASASWYEEQASLAAPYAAGILHPDTLAAMKGMSNFYRWLIGVGDLEVNAESDASLQAQALDRNFQFDHFIDNASKPEDMEQELWEQGFACDHNILALYSTPAGSITNWMNEGYRLSSGTWDTVGHRTAILSSAYNNISYGYSGRVAVGKCGKGGNTFSNAFAAFPAAGYMPANLLSKAESAWTVELNKNVVQAKDSGKVSITVENLRTGESYSCSTAAGTARVSSTLLQFVQPSDAAGSYYTDPYKVTVTGLTDVAQNKAAAITYEVDFFTLNTLTDMSVPQTMYAWTGSEVRPAVTVRDASNTVLTEGKDYRITCYNNIDEGTAVVEVAGMGDYCGVLKKFFTIEEDHKTLDQCAVSISSSGCTYSGEALTPAVTVSSFGKILTEGTDYEVTYKDNVEPGTGTATLRGLGEYSGTVEKTFQISKIYPQYTRSLSAYEIEVGGTATITASAQEGAEISFSSSNETVATVDADGTIHAWDEGTAYIYITIAETEHYRAAYGSVRISGSKDIHTMVDTNVTYADAENNEATVTRKCSVCGKEETVSFTTMSDIGYVYYWTGSRGYSYLSNAAFEGECHDISLGSYSPSDAENTELKLESSDPAIMETDGQNFRFVGTGTVTLTVSAKYNPSVRFTKTFTVDHVWEETGTVLEASTCATKGEIQYTCKECGATKTEELPLDPENHTGETYLKNAKEETCGEDGFTGNIYCAGCNLLLSEGSVIPATGNHAWNDFYTVDQAATCTEEGQESVYCTICGALKEGSTRIIPVREKIDIDRAEIADIRNRTYTGSPAEQDIRLVWDGQLLQEGFDYELSYQNNINAGTATVTVTGLGIFTGTSVRTFTIAPANQTLSKAVLKKTLKAKTLRKKNQVFKIGAAAKGNAKVTYQLLSVPKKAKKLIKVSSAGKVTVKKGLKKGTYKIKVRIKAAQTQNYKAAAVTKTLKIVVR